MLFCHASPRYYLASSKSDIITAVLQQEKKRELQREAETTTSTQVSDLTDGTHHETDLGFSGVFASEANIAEPSKQHRRLF